MSRWRNPVGPALVALLLVGALVFAQPGVQGENSTQLTATTVDRAVDRIIDPMQEVTPERAAAAETFARLHHPDLAELLSRLKAARHGDYDNAIRDLFRESERLAKLKGRDSQRYELELEGWKTASRIQLATARLAMEDSSELREELRILLRAKVETRVSLMKLDRERLTHRIEKLDGDLQSLQSDPAAQVEQDLERLLKSARVRANQAARKGAAARQKAGQDAGTKKVSEAATERPAANSQRGPVVQPVTVKP
ncbi:MAG: hypothetical protein ACK5Q5_09210 [Planctomycetaceae bacterium]